MEYTIQELREKLIEKISNLGIDPKFKENPAFATALAEIEDIIEGAFLGESQEKIFAYEKNGNISISFVNSLNIRYAINIQCVRPETFTCTISEEKNPFDDKDLIEKNFTEKIVTLTPIGEITIVTNSSSVNNIDSNKSVNITPSAEQDVYSTDGIMKIRDSKIYKTYPLAVDISNVTISDALSLSRLAFNLGAINNNFIIRTYLERNYLDVATMLYTDRPKGITFYSKVLLSSENGLRKMSVPNGFPYSDEIVIGPLKTDKIEALIANESNPKVAEGLRKIAVGRDNFYYNSKYDNNFVYKGISQGKSL